MRRSVYWQVCDRSPPWIAPRSSRPRRSPPPRRRRTPPVQPRGPTAACRVPRSRRRRARHQRARASPRPRGTPPRSTRGRAGGERGGGSSCAPLRSRGHAGGRGPRWGVTRPPAACARMGIATRSRLQPTFGVPRDAPMGVVRDVHRWVPISLFRPLPRSGTHVLSRFHAENPLRQGSSAPPGRGLPRRPSPIAASPCHRLAAAHYPSTSTSPRRRARPRWATLRYFSKDQPKRSQNSARSIPMAT